MSKMSGDESEVVFDQPGKKAGAMEPDGSVPNRRKEEGRWEATEPYHGARPRKTEFDRPVDIGLGATIGGLEEGAELRDGEVPRLPPEKQIQLDCVPPDAPLRDIVDRCRVWESHADPEVRRISKPLPEPVYPTYVVEQPDYETEPVCVVTVNKPNNPVDQSKELLKKLLAVLPPTVLPPARAPDESPRDKLVQLLLSEAVKREPAPPMPAEPPGLETLLRTYFAEQQSPRQGPGSDKYDVTTLPQALKLRST